MCNYTKNIARNFCYSKPQIFPVSRKGRYHGGRYQYFVLSIVDTQYHNGRYRYLISFYLRVTILFNV